MNPNTTAAACSLLQADGSVKVNVRTSPIAICVVIDLVIDLVIEHPLRLNVHALGIALYCCHNTSMNAHVSYATLMHDLELEPE